MPDHFHGIIQIISDKINRNKPLKYIGTLRYRKSGKTLCSFFPEKDAFTVLIVLGKKEVEKILSLKF